MCDMSSVYICICISVRIHTTQAMFNSLCMIEEHNGNFNPEFKAMGFTLKYNRELSLCGLPKQIEI